MNIAIPYFLSHLKVDHRGYPIPYFVGYVNGVPDFRLMDSQRQQRCAEKRLCGICGKKLFEYFYFITGPIGLMNCTHSDPAMHKECAEYSVITCPHLHFEKAQRNERGDVYKVAASLNTTGILTKSREIFVIKSDKYRLIPVNEGHIFGFRKLTWRRFEYVNGILSEVADSLK